MIKFVVITMLMICRICFADIYVVANQKNPLDKLSLQEVQALYLGRTKALPNGQFVHIFDREDHPAIRQRFFKAIADLNLSQVDAFWARLIFAGRMLPLNTVNSDDALFDKVSQQPNALGYAETPPKNKTIKTLLVIKEN